ncbi:hypothetical protein RAS2_00360 [Phycisphaerae bacterium RAS2]|nr:hypothetical protein RAS2_00360 [Phycisphaerae bacterium RAS2]
MGVLSGCKPRVEVLKGDLDDAIFAADFGDLIAEKAPKVYRDPRAFFQNTHPAKHLCQVVQAVFGRLSAAKEGGTTIRLSTAFGGGKTHTLMALWHLANGIDDPALGTDLLPAAGRPSALKAAAVDASKAGFPEFASHGKTKVHSLWGEIFYRLDEEKGLRLLGKADDPEASPSEGQIESVFPNGPVLILLDELVVYMAKLSERGQGNLLGFLNSLMSVVSKRPQTVLIITDPGAQAAYATQSNQLGATLQSAAAKLDDIFGRKVSDFDPIGDESARVIVRRLFESVNNGAAQASSATYHSLYERVCKDAAGSLPAESASGPYAKRIVDCYPFHPRLLDTATDRLGAMQDFQKSRGVLRLFARIIRDVWDAKDDVELITAGEIDWASSRIQADLLNRLNRNEFKAAISADIDKHGGELDGGATRGVHRRVASAIMLESIPLTPNSGLEPADLALVTLRPDEAGPEPAEAMDRLMGVCWHTYPTISGRGCQFRFEPNVLKQIEERVADIPMEDARSRVLAEAQGYFQGMTFKVAAWPTSARQVPESAALQLALCADERIAKAVVAYGDDSDPAAPMPRGFQNAIFAVTATPTALNEAIRRAQRLMAAEAIEKENKGDSGKMVREQLKKISPELVKQFGLQTRRAFDRIVLPGGAVKALDEKYQVPDEQILQKPQGQTCVRKFLDGNKLIYEPNDALDVGRFIRDVLPGAVPIVDQPDVFTAKAIHERFLGAPGLRLIPDGSIVRQTVLRALTDGKIVIRFDDGRAYDAKGRVEGAEGRRRRVADSLTTFPLDDSVRVAAAGSTAANAWLKEDAPTPPGGGGGTGGTGGTGGGDPTPPPPPVTPGRVTATSWEKVLEYANERPLLELRLIAKTPGDAAMLPNLVQPISAEQLSVSVSASGMLKDGGDMNFAASNVKLNHPTKPLGIAQTIFNSLVEGGSYEVEFKLTFGAAGRTGMLSQLQQTQGSAPDGIAVKATFDKPAGGTK